MARVRFGWVTVPAVPVSAPGKNLPAVPDSGSSSVPENNTFNFDALARLFLTGSHWGQKVHAFKRHQSRNALKNAAGKGFGTKNVAGKGVLALECCFAKEVRHVFFNASAENRKVPYTRRRLGRTFFRYKTTFTR